MRRPANVVYGLDEKPPLLPTAANAVQHVALIGINVVYPLIVFRAAGAPTALVANLVAIGMIVLGIGTFLQASRRGPMGSGYLCPSTFTGAYFAPSLVAAKMGGLPLLFGMTVFAGVLEALIAPALNRLRAIFPSEISGLVIFMIGLSAAMAGAKTLVGAGAEPMTAAEWWVTGITLWAMVALNVWGKGLARMLCALIGLAAGYVAAALFGLFGADQLAQVGAVPWVALPSFGHLSWSFELAAAAPFTIACLAVSMKAVGTITLCQRMNDADWVRPDTRSIQRGVLADGATTVLAGLVSGYGTNTSTPSVGLAAATGVASRRIAFAVAAAFVLLGLAPEVATLLALMPRSVMVAALLFTVCFILINGLQVMTSRMLDARRTVVLGLSIVAGVAVEVFPAVAGGTPAALRPIVGSSLVFATLVALALNLLFRIGVKRTVRRAIEPGGKPQEIEDLLKAQGAAWGARPDVIARACFGVSQLIEAVAESCWRGGPMTMAISFDEFNVEVTLSYEGERLIFPDRRPTDAEIRDTDEGMRSLAGFLLRHNADRVRSEADGSQARVHFHFDH